MAVSLLRQQTAGPTFTSTIGGKDVQWSFRAPATPTLPTEVLNWEGWGFLPAAGRAPLPVFRSRLLPADLEEQYKVAHAKVTATTPVWRTKVVFFRESDILDRDELGVVRRRYTTLEPFQVEEMMPALARFAALVEIASDGHVQAKIDVESDNTMMQFDRTPGTAPWDDRFASRYFGPRLNGPGFATEEKVFRGPYQSVFYIHPGLSGAGTVDAWVDDMPVTGLSLTAEPLIPTPGSIDASLVLAWERHAHRIAENRGAPAEYVPSETDWPLLCKPELTAQEQEALMTPHLGKLSVLRTFPRMFEMAPLSTNVEVGVAKDADRGNVLTYAESGLERGGGMAAPVAASGPLFNVRTSPILSFWAKSASDEPVAVTLYVNGMPKLDLVLGRNDPPRNELDESKPERRAVPLAFKADGTWQRVTVDLSKYLSDQTGWLVTALLIEPPSTSRRFPKAALGKIEYQFDDFSAGKEAPGPLTAETTAPAPSTSGSAEAKCLFLAHLTNDSSTDDLDAGVRLLSDPDAQVKLNAVYAFTHVQYPSGLVGLFEQTKSLNPRLAQLSVRALAHQDDPTGWSVVRKMVEDGTYDVAREEAARALGSLKDPSMAGALSTTVDSKSRYDKIAAVEAIAGLPGDEAPQILMAFVNDDEPEVRLSVVRAANLEVPSVAQIIVYTAANDLSDKVRAASYLRLLESPDPALRSEGYKGVHDDGELVRLAVVEALAARGKEEDRPAIKAGLEDASPKVRAAALRAMTKQPSGVSLEDLGKAANDPNPLVQDALLDLSDARKLTLPAPTLQALRASKVPKIAAKAKGAA